MNILVIGSGAREHAIVAALHRSPQNPQIYCCGSTLNPGIRSLTQKYWVGEITDVTAILQAAEQWQIELAIIGPEAPLEKGLADVLWENAVPTIGPKQKLAQIETSKRFARDLMQKYQISGLPRYQVFHTTEGVQAFFAELGEGNYVVKADGLMGGKGVKVAGDHLASIAEAIAYCQEILVGGQPVVIEEKLIGQEFSFMCFCDGKNLVPMPIVQDHKRAFVDDKGPNTGGMGSYSMPNHSLPFLTEQDVQRALEINSAIIHALSTELQETYVGVLYGSFIATRDGVSVIEFNARFGDPEALNVLSILESDFVALCQGWVRGKLTPALARFASQATVCKYAVPQGYPDAPLKNGEITIQQVQDQRHLYLSSVNAVGGKLYAAGSRTVAYVGVADTASQAEVIAETEISKVRGPLFHREDIGTDRLIQKRVSMMQQLRHGLQDQCGVHVRLGILSSSRGTNLDAIVAAIQSQQLAATIEIVVSNQLAAPILERAKSFGLKAEYVDPRGLSREEFDRCISDLFQRHQVDLIVLIGYMRILSKPFIAAWQNKVINVHPSLLPLHAGQMDLAVHSAVLEASERETGCTVHYVTENVDSGPILVQKHCPVLAGDTPEILKARVQLLEGAALIEAVQMVSG